MCIPNTLDEGIDNLARGAFFFHYVTDVSKVFDVLETLYMHRSGQKPLQASVDAASLAFFSFQQDSIKARHLARKQYLLALPQVNAALQSLANASSDSTLLAVLLLDLFEKFMGEPRSTTAWMSHVHGALALIKLRGRSQLHDYIGLRLSARLSMNLLISCVAASTRVPAALLDLRSDLENFLDKNDPKWQVTGLVIQYASHDADIRRSCHWTPGTINSMLRLDEEFRRLAGNMPTSWSFKTISIDEPSGRALEPYFHVYRDHAITQTWNVLRTTRILLNDTMRKHHLNFPHDKGNGSDSEQRYDVVETIDLLAREICASAYQFTQLRDESRSMHYSAFERARCYTLMFPLYVAAMYASVSTGIRPWVVKQLCFLSETVRIRQAKAVVDILGKGNDPDPWSIYALLGSYAFAA
ncbi:MAG: hypothetical protein LQ346_004569 [Caloplaca aetnensis]|nr:MAG: hypothetical protein LQ346_004569 [Caloplaca aetnensis]